MNEIGAELRRDERLLWSGAPGPVSLRSGMTLATAAPGAFFVVFSVVWTTAATASLLGGASRDPEPVFAVFPLFGLVFVALGLSMLLGPTLARRRRLGRTSYGVTDLRVLIVERRGAARQVLTEAVRTLPTLELDVRVDGRGTLRFGRDDAPAAGAALLLGPWAALASRRAPAFEEISDVRAVASLVEDLRLGRPTS